MDRMEDVKLRRSSGIAKVTSIAFCLAGVLTIAFFSGPSISPVNHHRAFSDSAASKPTVSKGVWIIWTFLMVVANMFWSLWIVLQVYLTHQIIIPIMCFLVTRVSNILFFETKFFFHNKSFLLISYDYIKLTKITPIFYTTRIYKCLFYIL